VRTYRDHSGKIAVGERVGIDGVMQTDRKRLWLRFLPVVDFV
jgi:hypothetical protein